MVDLTSIRTVAMLEGLAQSHLDELGAIACEVQASAGERLIARGEPAETFYIAKEGTFALTVGLRRLGTTVELGVEEKGAGAALGWSALVPPHEAIYSCYCTADGSLFAFPRAELARLMSANLELGGLFMVNLSRLIGDRVRVMQDLWVDEVQQSLARVEYWTHREITDHVTHATEPKRNPRRGARRLFGRGGGSHPSETP